MINKILLSTLLITSTGIDAADLSIEMIDLSSGSKVGSITASENQYGVVFTANMSGLPTGLHGFHLHQNPSCDTAQKNGKTVLGGAAGGHYDPMKTGKHGFPWGEGNHLGDLPPIYVNTKGEALQSVIATRLELSDLAGHSIMIHAGGDNHSDHPKALGGGGARIVCAVIK